MSTEALIQAIAANDSDQISYILKRLGLDQPGVTSQSVLIFLRLCALTCRKIGSREELLQSIFMIVDEIRLNIDRHYPLVLAFLLNISIEEDVKRYVIHCHSSKQPTDYFLDLVNVNSAKAAKHIAPLAKLFTLTNADWNYLVTLATPEMDPGESLSDYPANQRMIQEFEALAKASGGNRVKCPWVRDYEYQPPKDLPEFPDTVDAVDIIAAAIPGLETDTFIPDYCVSLPSEKAQFLAAVGYCELTEEVINLDDTGIFREFGPVNTVYSKLSAPGICGDFGGCHMFTCNCMSVKEYDDESEIDDTEFYSRDTAVNINNHLAWFTGSCDVCDAGIDKAIFAQRLPGMHGSWWGCYCQKDCLKVDVKTPGQAMAVGRMYEQLDVIGIRMR